MKKTIINSNVIEKLSNLSAIDFTDNEKELMIKEVSGIVDMLDACAKVDKVNVSEQAVSLDGLREDVETDSMIKRDEILSYAPRTENGYIVVPKVVD